MLVAAAAVAVIALAGGAVATGGFGVAHGGPRRLDQRRQAAQPDPGDAAAEARPRADGRLPRPSAATPPPGPTARREHLRADVDRSLAVAALRRARRAARRARGRPRRRPRARRAPAPGPGAAPPPAAGDRWSPYAWTGGARRWCSARRDGGRAEARVYSCGDAGTPVATHPVRGPLTDDRSRRAGPRDGGMPRT